MNRKHNSKFTRLRTALVFVCSIGLVLSSHLVHADSDTEQKSAEVKLDTDAAKLGYMFGFQIATNIKNDGLLESIDVDAFQAALDEILSGKESRMSLDEMQTAQKNFMIRKRQELEAVAAANKLKGDNFLINNSSKAGVMVTSSGLQYEVLRKGQGRQPTKQNSVLVNYRGTLIDGTEFDSSYARNKPVTFSVNGVVRGFSEGLLLMKEGARYRLTIPSKLAYGRNAPPIIGAEQVLVFDVELIEVK